MSPLSLSGRCAEWAGRPAQRVHVPTDPLRVQGPERCSVLLLQPSLAVRHAKVQAPSAIERGGAKTHSVAATLARTRVSGDPHNYGGGALFVGSPDGLPAGSLPLSDWRPPCVADLRGRHGFRGRAQGRGAVGRIPGLLPRVGGRHAARSPPLNRHHRRPQRLQLRRLHRDAGNPTSGSPRAGTGNGALTP